MQNGPREIGQAFSRRAFVSTAGAAALAATSGERPNVLIILPDEWRAQSLGCAGDPNVKTPNVDRLASEGILFRNMLANTPVCCPARANILTGTYTNRNGMIANDLRLRESIQTMGDWFASAGYRTGYIGKWHLDGGPRLPGFVPPGPRRHGFRFWAANECWHDYNRGSYYRDTDTPVLMTHHEAEEWTNVAIEFLRSRRDSAQPFFLMLAPGAPHDPYVAPQEYMRRYDARSLTMRPNWVGGIAQCGRKDIAGYYAAITAVDDQIGRLMREMRSLGLEENTITLFTSDHGNMLGSQGQTLKRKPWEESIGVPGIVHYSAKGKPGRKSDVLFTHVDIAPTLLGLCGIAKPAGLQGSDLSWTVLGGHGEGPQSAFFQIFGPFHGDRTESAWRAVRTRRYLYARTEAAPWLLYDLEKDPYEMTNLVNEYAAAKVRAEMERRLSAWMKKTGDSWKLDWTEPVEDGGRLYKDQVFYTVDEYLRWTKDHPGR